MAAARSTCRRTSSPRADALPFQGREQRVICDIKEAMGAFKTRIDAARIEAIEDYTGATAGVCGMMGTATRWDPHRALGMSLPGTATTPAVYAAKKRQAKRTGERILDMIREDLRPRSILKRENLLNAVRFLMAVGGSTNAVLHLPAIAAEAGCSLTLADIDAISSATPCIAKFKPSSRYTLWDFYEAGGVGAVLGELAGLIEKDAPTVTGGPIADYFTAVKDREVIRPLEDPLQPQGGIVILRGSLAPDGALVKVSGIRGAKPRHVGTAKTFDSEEEVLEQIMTKTVRPGDILVIRYEGPSGGPGMREMSIPAGILTGMGLGDSVAMITDGRLLRRHPRVSASAM